MITGMQTPMNWVLLLPVFMRMGRKKPLKKITKRKG